MSNFFRLLKYNVMESELRKVIYVLTYHEQQYLYALLYRIYSTIIFYSISVFYDSIITAIV